MTDDVDAHLDLDALADALAGEGDVESAAHLATCASCTSRRAELEAADARVVAVLGALPPPTVPDGLAERLSAAFAAEPALTSAARGTTGGSVTALPARGTRRRFLPAAAAAVVLVCGAGLGYALVNGSGGSDTADTASTAAGGADGAAAAEVPRSETGADYADAASVAGVLGQVLGGGATTMSEDSARSAAGTTSGGGAALEGAAPSGSGSPDGGALQAPAAAAAPPDPLARLRTPEGLADCLASLQVPGEPAVQPLAVDYATYKGQPALAVVLPDPDPDKVAIFVLAAGCSRAGDLTLDYLRVPRP